VAVLSLVVQHFSPVRSGFQVQHLTVVTTRGGSYRTSNKLAQLAHAVLLFSIQTLCSMLQCEACLYHSTSNFPAPVTVQLTGLDPVTGLAGLFLLTARY
jgi:hypothetical protein